MYQVVFQVYLKRTYDTHTRMFWNCSARSSSRLWFTNNGVLSSAIGRRSPDERTEKKRYNSALKHRPRRVRWRQARLTALQPWRSLWQHMDAAGRGSRTSISWHSIWGCSMRKMKSCPENISVAFAMCAVHRLCPRYRLDAVGGRLHSTVCMARCGLPTAFVWLCKSETIKDYVLYHATAVSSRTS